jgi:hypothetical protein
VTVRHGVNTIVSRLADAPNPADCPHHHCDYTPAGDAGLILLVALLVLAVIVVLAIVGVHRVRARRRRAEADDLPEAGPRF